MKNGQKIIRQMAVASNGNEQGEGVMKVEELRNYGKTLAEMMEENWNTLEKPYKKEFLKIIRKDLGLLGGLRLWFFTRQEQKRLSSVDLTSMIEKGLKSQFFIDAFMGNTAGFSAMKKIVGKEKTLAIQHEVMDKVAYSINEIFYPPINQLKDMEDTFAAFRDYMAAMFSSQKAAGLHDFEVIENSEDTFAINITYCALCEIPRLCGVIEACDPNCYSDDVFFPKYGEPLGIRYSRTKTLSRGGDCCDYRFEKIK